MSRLTGFRVGLVGRCGNVFVWSGVLYRVADRALCRALGRDAARKFGLDLCVEGRCLRAPALFFCGFGVGVGGVFLGAGCEKLC